MNIGKTWDIQYLPKLVKSSVLFWLELELVLITDRSLVSILSKLIRQHLKLMNLKKLCLIQLYSTVKKKYLLLIRYHTTLLILLKITVSQIFQQRPSAEELITLKKEIFFSPKITLLKRMAIQVWIEQSFRKALGSLKGGTYSTIKEQMNSIARLLKHGV